MLQMLARMFANNIDQRKDTSEKTLTKIKSHQELLLKIRNQQVLFPNLATMLNLFIQVNRTFDRSRKSMKRHTLIPLSIRVICKDEVNSIGLK